MNPGNYSLSEVRKGLVAVLFLGLAVAALFTTISPSFTVAVIALVGPVFAVIGVFAAKHHSADDLQKALEQLKGAVIGVLGFFVAVPSSTQTKVSVIIGAAVSVLAVYWTRNVKQ